MTFFAVIIWCCSYLFIIIIICLQASRVILVTPTLSACLTAMSKPLSQKCLTLLNLFHEKGPVCLPFLFHEASVQHFNRCLVLDQWLGPASQIPGRGKGAFAESILVKILEFFCMHFMHYPLLPGTTGQHTEKSIHSSHQNHIFCCS